MHRRLTLPLIAVFLAAPPSAARGQEPASAYLDGYRELTGLRSNGQVARVEHLVLRRDAGELVLERGALYLLTPIGGQTVGAVFRGTGRFSFAPPPSIPTEQAQLARFAGSTALDDTVTEVILLFADSTLEALRGLSFAGGEVPSEVDGHVRDLTNSLKDDADDSFNGDVLSPFLNGERSGFFLARMERAHGGPLLFRYDPALGEAVQLHRPVGRREWGANWAVVAQFPPRQPLPGSDRAWRYRQRLGVLRYQVDVRLTPTAMSDLDFAAGATLTLKAEEPVGPWLLFSLEAELRVDSARWSDGAAAAFFKAKDGNDLWVRAARRLQAGDSLALTVYYRGNLIDRFSDWFFVDPLADWYPVSRQGRNQAVFDLTYHSPNWYPLASVGERTDSTVTARVLTTRWLTDQPRAFASFNLGLFESYRVQHPGAPPLEVLISEDAHRALRREFARVGIIIPEQRRMRENVAADVSNSLKLFTALFGECTPGHFFVTEIPYGEGVSFPGLIHLSWATFQNTAQDGFDEFFRAHEVAHQWWGNDVQPASYRDAWLSEGMASFLGLWYLRSVRRRNDEYAKFLEQYRANIREYRETAGPIWVGYRNATPTTRGGYQVMIYEKGAWVLHMLRILMLDLQTGSEDRFLQTLRDFYQSYRGRSATTDDFQAVVERHAGVPMDWFFDQWVKGTDIPTYHVAWTKEAAEGGRFRVRLRVTQENVRPDFQMFVLVAADLGNNRFAHFRVNVKSGQTEYLSPLLPLEPRGIQFNELQSVLADVKMEGW